MNALRRWTMVRRRFLRMLLTLSLVLAAALTAAYIFAHLHELIPLGIKLTILLVKILYWILRAIAIALYWILYGLYHLIKYIAIALYHLMKYILKAIWWLIQQCVQTPECGFAMMLGLSGAILGGLLGGTLSRKARTIRRDVPRWRKRKAKALKRGYKLIVDYQSRSLTSTNIDDLKDWGCNWHKRQKRKFPFWHPNIELNLPQRVVHVRLEEDSPPTEPVPKEKIYWDALYDMHNDVRLSGSNRPIGGTRPMFERVIPGTGGQKLPGWCPASTDDGGTHRYILTVREGDGNTEAHDESLLGKMVMIVAGPEAIQHTYGDGLPAMASQFGF